MLGNVEALATVGVKEIARAKKFYGGTLGLREVPTKEPGVQTYTTGKGRLLVYESTFAGTNEATSVTWEVPDVEAVVKDLKAKGITFEHYDMPGITRKGDIHVAGDLKNAWFKDPDGNIHSVVGK